MGLLDILFGYDDDQELEQLRQQVQQDICNQSLVSFVKEVENKIDQLTEVRIKISELRNGDISATYDAMYANTTLFSYENKVSAKANVEACAMLGKSLPEDYAIDMMKCVSLDAYRVACKLTPTCLACHVELCVSISNNPAITSRSS